MSQPFQRLGIPDGAPHFHIFLSGLPRSGVEGVARAWFRIVGSGDEKHLLWHLGKLSGRPCLEWMRKPHAASAYATKYATKMEQKEVPEQFRGVGRFWGHFGKMKPVWKFICGFGSHCGKATRDLVINFRSRFDPSPERWLDKSFFSSTLWGASEDIDDLLRFVGWVPF